MPEPTNGDKLAYEVVKLLVTLKDYRQGRPCVFYLNETIDRIMQLLIRRPGLAFLMDELGLTLNSNGDRKYR